MLKITLRNATLEDSEFVFLVKKAALGPYIEQTWGWDENFQRQYHQNDFAAPETQIIQNGRHDVGWMVHRETEADIELQDIYLLPEHQGRGIGSYLIRLLLGEAERRKKPVRLQVLKVNDRARQLYERLGFSMLGETDKYYLMSCESWTTTQAAKTLDVAADR